tara:strand:- start:9 stop:1007 length:999 start_codon:yes stop_codon:yes gene_type:complete
MFNLALRSPQFKTIVAGSGTQSTVLDLLVNSIQVYNLIRNKTITGTITQAFEISELVRDYLDIEYVNSYVGQYVTITCVIKNYDGLNGSGTQQGATVVYDNIGTESYGTYTEEVNPSVPFRAMPTYGISPDFDGTFTIFAPFNKAGFIPSIDAIGFPYATPYSSTDTSVLNNNLKLCNIKRIDCTKYGDGNKIVFINKYGCQQDLWFFLKDTKTIKRTNENYKANTMEYLSTGPEYNIQNAPSKIFNTQALNTFTLSSGYYPEFANQFFEELLLSEYVWIERVIVGQVSKAIPKIPVKVKNSSIAFKTVLNDKLIEYTIEFEEAFDYINNIR